MPKTAQPVRPGRVFPVFSLFIREMTAETGSHETPCTAIQSGALAHWRVSLPRLAKSPGTRRVWRCLYSVYVHRDGPLSAKRRISAIRLSYKRRTCRPGGVSDTAGLGSPIAREMIGISAPRMKTGVGMTICIVFDLAECVDIACADRQVRIIPTSLIGHLIAQAPDAAG